MEVAAASAYRLDMDLRGGGGDKLGSIYLKIAPLNEERPDRLNHPGAQEKIPFPGGQSRLLMRPRVILRPLKNAQFRSRPRRVRILTTGIY